MAQGAVSRHVSGELPHVAIFPFMARGHTIPLTHLAYLLLRRRLAFVTFFTTPGNAVFVRALLPAGAHVVELPFPAPQGAENVEDIASASSFADFAEATLALRPRFEEALASMRPAASLLVADVGSSTKPINKKRLLNPNSSSRKERFGAAILAAFRGLSHCII